MTRLIDPVRPSKLPLQEEFPYGWREVRQSRPDGTAEYVRVPLTAQDVLHPQEGDVIGERVVQEKERGYLARVFRYQMRGNPTAMVTSDCLIEWSVQGIRPHSPDVCVFDSVRETQADYGTFPVVEQGARVLLATEIVSPRDRDPEARNNDVVHKFNHYHRIGVPLYLIVDQEREGGPRALLLYRHAPAGYRLVPPDAQGRVLLEPVGVLVGLRDNNVVCYDAATGEEFPDYGDAIQAKKAAAEARKAAEDKAQAAAEARKAAEDRVRTEAEARKAAEDKWRSEAGARKDAEDKARSEAEARKAAEDKLRALEEELQKLRGLSGPGPTP
jgi:Uma2 family endonuclease